MHTVFLVPNWFLGYDVFLEFTFAAITLLASIMAFKVYSISGQPQARLFGAGFLLISLSYLVQAVLNLFILTEINEAIDNVIELVTITQVNGMGVWTHMILFLSGLAMLTYMTLNSRNWRLYVLTLALLMVAVWLSSSRLYAFYILSMVLLAFTALHYLLNFLLHKRVQTFIVFLAFLLLLFGSVHFTLSLVHSVEYVIGHLAALVAYTLILINLVMVWKHEQEKG
ncbi:hypothetical protein JW826_03755 [Candidatus Woesearchaeota archaeon]|nr:hypothetical protein [Candidatus Woesearchaeota archaeon]